MKRFGTWAFGALAAATVAAFFVTQHLKVSDPLISGYPHTSPAVIAPGRAGCGGRYRVTRLSFYLQHRADDVSVSIVEPGGRVLRTVTKRRHMLRNVRSLFVWDGRTDRGIVAPDGTYYWRIVLLGQGRTIRVATAITVRDTPPQPRVVSVTPRTGAAGATIRYTGVQEGDRVTVRLFGPGAPRLALAFVALGRDQAVWDGQIHGQPAPPGSYAVGLAVTDAACGAGQVAGPAITVR